jgi:hypothetical protein
LQLGSSINLVQESRVALILGDIRNPTFYQYLWQILETLKNQNCDVSIVDIPMEVTGKGIKGNYFQRQLSNVTPEELKNLKMNFVAEVSSRPQKDVSVISPSYRSDLGDNYKLISMSEVLESFEFSELLKTSVASSFQTKVSKSIDLSLNPRRYRGDLAALVNSFLRTKEYLTQLDLKDSFDTIVFMNGRQPHQAACLEYAQDHSLKWFSVEHNPFESKFKSFHFEPFLPQDFLSMQKNYLANYHACSSKIESMKPKLESWFYQQRNFGPSFGPAHSPTELTSVSNGVRTFAIFTSTLSEYDYMLEQQDRSWSQFEAISKLIKKIKSDYFDAEIVVRIHPNQRNYSWHDLIELNRVISSPGVKVVQPWESTTSYSILDTADYVIVWNSTIGLEAVYWGKKTLCLSNTFYNLVVSMPKLSPENLGAFKFEDGVYPAQSNAIEALGFMLFSGEELTSKQNFEGTAKKFSHRKSQSAISNLRSAFFLQLYYLMDGKYVGPLGRPVLLERLLTKLFGARLAIWFLNRLARLLSNHRP